MRIIKKTILLGSMVMAGYAAEAEMKLDAMSVTATKVERATKDVPESISVIDSIAIDEKQVANISDAINDMPGVFAVSTNGGYDSRLIIRGAGLKAPYGVREIMVVRDGVPMTDPDSFSRFDFIDMQDMERIEVTKGPGSIFATNASGGVIQLISKSVFDAEGNRIKVGSGSFGAQNLHARVAGQVSENNFVSLTASKRELESDWRRHNKYDSTNVSLKHGYRMDEGAKWETEFSYSAANMEIPGSMDEVQFKEYKDSGEQKENNSQWKHSARNSKILFLNTKYEKSYGDLTVKPRLYANSWDHFHPVTGIINEKEGTTIVGADLEFNLGHHLLSESDMLVFGLAGRQEEGADGKKYTYRDVVTDGTGKILYTTSDAKGELASVEDANSKIYGFYLQESVKPAEKVLVDLSVRYDTIAFHNEGTDYIVYNYGTKKYTTLGTPEAFEMKESYNLHSAKAGVSYALTQQTSLFALISRANQAPTDSEISTNKDNGSGKLDPSTTTNYEVGLKHRAKAFSLDVSLYQMRVQDEIVSTYSDGTTYYENAGETEKKGAELALAYSFEGGVNVGGTYTYSDYTFADFDELVTTYPMGVKTVTPTDRSGNQLPYIPKEQYSLFAGYMSVSGFQAKLSTTTWGPCYMDNANTEKYEGYRFATSMMLGYMHDAHMVQLNVENLFDQRYAVEATKDVSGRYSYAAAAPRSIMATYTYSF